VSAVVVDDHLLRDILTDQPSPELTIELGDAELYTTNLWYLVFLLDGRLTSDGGVAA